MENEEIIIDQIVEENDDEGNDTTDWKSIALKNEGIAKRLKTKLEKSKEVREPKDASPVQKEEKSDDLDYGKKAFLRSYDIKGADELELVKSELKKSGETLDALIENPYFKTKLDNLRSAKASLDATPRGDKRGGQQVGSVEYHYAKYQSTGKLPEDRAMAEKVVEMRLSQEKDKGMFTDNPVVG